MLRVEDRELEEREGIPSKRREVRESRERLRID